MVFSPKSCGKSRCVISWVFLSHLKMKLHSIFTVILTPKVELGGKQEKLVRHSLIFVFEWDCQHSFFLKTTFSAGAGYFGISCLSVHKISGTLYVNNRT